MGLFKSNNPFRHAASNADDNHDNDDGIGPPPGPPPPHITAATGGPGDYAPPAGPPPAYHHHYQEQQQQDDYSSVPPPPGPPPSAQQQQQQHDWQSVALPEDDDTSSYPPPPALFSGHDRSWATNATEAQAEEGEKWCRRYALLPPTTQDPRHPALQAAPRRLVTPAAHTFRGSIHPGSAAPHHLGHGGSSSSSISSGPGGGGGGAHGGVWTVRTDRRCGDSCITAQPPAYLARRDDPRATGRARTIYFEVVVRRDLGPDAGLGLGFAALPYPPFRMPGWHRGSLGVHSDDGHRYVNDLWGGDDFVTPFGKKGVVGLGMRFSASSAGGAGGGGGGANGWGGIEVECFMTRNGRVEGRWDVNELRDAQRDREPVGVQGFHDLVVAVGVFGEVDVEVVLDPGRWMYKGVE